jgi:hypothetical protein
MKCSTVKDELSRYVEGALPGHAQAAIAQHLAACPACQAEAEGCRRAEGALRSLVTVVPAPDLSADLRRRLSAVGSRPRPLRWLWAGTALAAAAAALLALRAPVPPAPPHTVLREPAAAQGRPPQFAIQPVTEGDGARRPTAPPAPSAAALRRSSAPPHRVLRVRHIAPPAASLQDIAPEPPGEAADATALHAPRPELAPGPRPPAPAGIVLLVAAPQPPRPSSSYYGEVTLPDGAVSSYQETVERNAAGEPQSVKIVCQQTPPQAGAGNGG